MILPYSIKLEFKMFFIALRGGKNIYTIMSAFLTDLIVLIFRLLDSRIEALAYAVLARMSYRTAILANLILRLFFTLRLTLLIKK